MSIGLGIRSVYKSVMSVMLSLPSGLAGARPGYRDEKDRGDLICRRGRHPAVYRGTGHVTGGVHKGHVSEVVTSEPEKKVLETSSEMEAGEGEEKNIPGPVGLLLASCQDSAVDPLPPLRGLPGPDRGILDSLFLPVCLTCWEQCLDLVAPSDPTGKQGGEEGGDPEPDSDVGSSHSPSFSVT